MLSVAWHSRLALGQSANGRMKLYYVGPSVRGVERKKDISASLNLPAGSLSSNSECLPLLASLLAKN